MLHDLEMRRTPSHPPSHPVMHTSRSVFSKQTKTETGEGKRGSKRLRRQRGKQLALLTESAILLVNTDALSSTFLAMGALSAVLADGRPSAFLALTANATVLTYALTPALLH
mmetsp:Transcript_38903/g.76462  ORF Transcript_38903/g.76462 Transcript_38903/m.76462 type:complete len:112 (-) Transcript_38903:506-841(-)